MNNNIAYNIRRNLQTIAYNLTSDEIMSKTYFKIMLKQKLNLDNPTTFNEKIQWYKLNYCAKNDLVVQCADKYRIREYLEKKNLMQYAIPIVGFWEHAKDISWDELPNKFAIKCNHGCAYNIICKDKNNLDIKRAEKQLDKWMKEDFGKFNAEPHYDKIKKGIVCEKYLGDGTQDYLVDYKIHCFNGKAKNILICSGRKEHSANYVYYDMNWKKLNYSKTESDEFAKPDTFNEMVKVSEMIAKDFPFVRVDFYEINKKPILGELTFVPASGLDKTITYEADVEMGNLLDLSRIN